MDLDPAPPRSPLIWPDIILDIASVLDQPDQVYLVGGIVRDALRSRPGHDVDLAVPAHGLTIARNLADKLTGAYYPIDRKRETGRVILNPSDDQSITIDIATFRGADLLEDLQLRDFTINAMASRFDRLEEIIDPLDGQADLFDYKILRQCHTESMTSDPIRAIRAVRLAIALDLRIEPQTIKSARAARVMLSGEDGLLNQPERARDELFKILSGRNPAGGLRLLDTLGMLEHLCPFEFVPGQMSNLLTLAEHTGRLLSIISHSRDDNTAADLTLGVAVMILDRYRAQLNELFERTYGDERARSALLFLSILSPPNSSAGNVWKDHLRLTNDEAVIIDGILQGFYNPLPVADLSDRALYRHFRASGEAGIDGLVLTLAQFLTNNWPTPDSSAWAYLLEELADPILKGYFRRHQEIISPPPLASGQDIIDHLGIEPGPVVGALFEQLLEDQAAGELKTKKQALRRAEHLYSNWSDD